MAATATSRVPPLASVSFAKNPEHDRFLLDFEGEIRGRYILAVLAGAGVLGGPELREQIEDELAHPSYLPDTMYSARDYIFVCDRAARAGLSFVRIGELIFPAYKRAHPDLFAGKTVFDALGMLEYAYRTETSWGGMSPPREVHGNRAVLYRKLQPAPCDMGIGVLRGLLKCFDATGTVAETACEWSGSPSGCCLEVAIDESP